MLQCFLSIKSGQECSAMFIGQLANFCTAPPPPGSNLLLSCSGPVPEHSRAFRNPPEPSRTCTGTFWNWTVHRNPLEPSGTLGKLCASNLHPQVAHAGAKNWAEDPISSRCLGEKHHSTGYNSKLSTPKWMVFLLNMIISVGHLVA